MSCRRSVPSGCMAHRSKFRGVPRWNAIHSPLGDQTGAHAESRVSIPGTTTGRSSVPSGWFESRRTGHPLAAGRRCRHPRVTSGPTRSPCPGTDPLRVPVLDVGDEDGTPLWVHVVALVSLVGAERHSLGVWRERCRHTDARDQRDTCPLGVQPTDAHGAHVEQEEVTVLAVLGKAPECDEILPIRRSDHGIHVADPRIRRCDLFLRPEVRGIDPVDATTVGDAQFPARDVDGRADERSRSGPRAWRQREQVPLGPVGSHDDEGEDAIGGQRERHDVLAVRRDARAGAAVDRISDHPLPGRRVDGVQQFLAALGHEPPEDQPSLGQLARGGWTRQGGRDGFVRCGRRRRLTLRDGRPCRNCLRRSRRRTPVQALWGEVRELGDLASVAAVGAHDEDRELDLRGARGR